MAKYFDTTGVNPKDQVSTFPGRRTEKIPGYNNLIHEKTGE
jgi:hypothetical protein